MSVTDIVDISAAPAETADYTFVLRLDDRPGAMELIAATFAHRGISITATLGNDGAVDPSGHAVVLVHFHATMARKEALKRTLTRLSRVRSLAEHAPNDTEMRRSALIRCPANTEKPVFATGVAGTVEAVSTHPVTGEVTFALMGPPADVLHVVNGLADQGKLIAVTHAVLAL